MEQLKRAVEQTQTRVRSFYDGHKKLCLAAAVTVGGVVAARTSLLCARAVRQSRLNRYFRSLEEDVVHLFIHRRWSHGPNFFPQCVKIESFLRVARIPYVVHFTDDVSMSPNGRLPFIVHNSTVLADGDVVLQYLSETFNVTLDDRLSPTEHAKGLMIKCMTETSINYGFNRTIFVDYTKILVNMVSVEFNLQPVVATVLVRGMRHATINVLNAVGYGDLSQEQYELEFLRDMQSLEAFIKSNNSLPPTSGSAAASLANSPLLFGDTPTSYDCSVYAWLQVAGEMGPHGPALSFLAGSKTLKAYIGRMNAIAFPDLESLQTAYETQRFIPS